MGLGMGLSVGLDMGVGKLTWAIQTGYLERWSDGATSQLLDKSQHINILGARAWRKVTCVGNRMLSSSSRGIAS